MRSAYLYVIIALESSKKRKIYTEKIQLEAGKQGGSNRTRSQVQARSLIEAGSLTVLF